MDTWQMIEDERASLVEALATLPESDWDKPSLCTGWTVREVVGHIIAAANQTPPSFFRKLIASGFSFTKLVNKDIERYTDGKSGDELVDSLRSRIKARTAPPGPTLSWLGETIVHSEDIFRALNGYREHPVDHVVAVGKFYAGSNLLIGSKKRIDGVTLRATDADWTHGEGPEARGPAIALVMAMTGRKVALDDLSGEGVAILRERN
jgi:uncharacterized protein (TIGR03083 family)